MRRVLHDRWGRYNVRSGSTGWFFEIGQIQSGDKCIKGGRALVWYSHTPESASDERLDGVVPKIVDKMVSMHENRMLDAIKKNPELRSVIVLDKGVLE